MNSSKRIAICGAPKVGKTIIFRRLTEKSGDQDYDSYIPTMGVDCYMNHNVSGNTIYYDFGGTSCHSSISLAYVRNIDLFIMVYDTLDKNTIKFLDEIYEKYTNYGWTGELLVVGNKKDKNSGYEIIDTILAGDQLADRLQSAHITISAKTGEDFEKLQEAVVYLLNPTTRSKVTFYPNPKHRKKTCFNKICGIL